MASAKRRDYYEVLEVAVTAAQDEIRTAYRKAALQWHPDKNVDNPELAAEKFKEIQNAYTVLSNPQERAWYDAHKDSILGGGDGTEGASGTSLNLWPYFSTSAFHGYDDDNSEGFWQVYSKVFTQIDEEEEGAENTDEYHEAAPAFGNSKTPYSEVSKFYTFWSNFVTRKDFVWCDQFNPAEAPNRMTKRWLEKHNKKARDKARKDFNEQVKHLVEFVRAHDKRVLEHMIKLKNEQAKKQEEQAKKSQEKQQKLKNMRINASQKNEDVIQFERELDNWLQSEDYTSMFETNKKGKSTQATGKEQQELYCMACKKGFKSEKQWENHEKSKKHKENVALLRESVLLDEDLEDSDAEISEDDASNHTTTTTTTTATTTNTDSAEDSRSGSDGEVDQEDHGDTNTGPGESDEEPPKHTQIARTPKTIVNDGQSDDGEEGSDDGEAQQDNHTTNNAQENGDGDSDDGLAQLQQRFKHLSKKKQKKQNQRKKKAEVSSDSDSDDGNGVSDDGSDDESNAHSTRGKTTPAAITTTTSTTTTPTTTTAAPTTTKQTKNTKAKQTKKAAPATTQPSKTGASSSAASPLSCSVCNASFTSRNALFKHINTLNHAVPLTQKVEPAKPKKKAK